MSLVGLVPSCHCAFVGTSWFQNFLSWVSRGSKKFFSWLFRGSKNFSWVFVGLKFFLVAISWVRIFFLDNILWAQFFPYRWFRDSKILGCWIHEQEWQKQEYKNTFETTYSFLNWFQQLQTVYIRKVLYLLNYYEVLICSNCIFRHLFSSELESFHSQ